jgi:hypothetical protein
VFVLKSGVRKKMELEELVVVFLRHQKIIKKIFVHLSKVAS